MRVEDEFVIRQREDSREKRVIASLAAQRLRDGSTLFLNDGTSTYALAQSIFDRPFTVFTTALNVAQLLAGSQLAEVFVIGGWLRTTSFGTIGSMATETISGLHADVAIIGPDGVTQDDGVGQHSLEDAAVAKAMSENSERTVVLASPRKIGRRVRARALGWAQVDEFVVSSLPTEFARHIEASGVRVVASTSGQA